MVSYHREMLAQTLREIMESLAFLFAEDMPQGIIPSIEVDNLCASLSYTGDLSAGTLYLVLPFDLCRELAANMLGMEKDDPESGDKGADALKETLNTICGRYLSAVFGEMTVFTLSIPQVRSMSPEEWLVMAKADDTLAFQVDGHPILAGAEETTSAVGPI